jgi:hypothetical protein
MKIKVTIFNPAKKHFGTQPEQLEFTGNYAIETMLIKIAEKFFGSKVSEQIEELLKTRVY